MSFKISYYCTEKIMYTHPSV